MGKVIHLKKIIDFIETTPVFRAKDVEILVGNKNYSHLMLHKLVRKGRVKRILKGWYSSHEDPVLSVFCFRPAYLGLQEALSLHGLWEQETNVVIVTTLKIRVGVREVFGNNVILHRIDKKYFFGFDYLKYGNFYVPVSDLEKTIIDLIYFKEIPGKDVLKEIKSKLNKAKFKSYLKKFPERFREKVIKVLEWAAHE